MRFSISQLLLFVAFLSVALLLAQLPGYGSMIILLFTIVIPSYFFLKTENWRCVVYGGLAGCLVLWFFASWTNYFLHLHLPRPPIRSRYDVGLPTEQIEPGKRIYPYVVPIGFLFGATIALGLWRWIRDREIQFDRSQLTECSHCGRVLSIHSIICPRCERRTESDAAASHDRRDSDGWA